MVKLFSVLFTLIATATNPESICDDGSSAWDENDRPNMECEIDGCVVIAPLCWPNRLDHCYDEDGSDNGSCSLREQSCDTALGCFKLYLACVGEWSCKDSRWWGCAAGTCTEAQPQPSPR